MKEFGGSESFSLIFKQTEFRQVLFCWLMHCFNHVFKSLLHFLMVLLDSLRRVDNLFHGQQFPRDSKQLPCWHSFHMQPNNSKPRYPAAFSSNFCTPSLYFLCPKSLYGQIPDNQRPLLEPRAHGKHSNCLILNLLIVAYPATQ